jgi:signal peptidase
METMARLVRRHWSLLVVVAAAGCWVVLLRPTGLGGPATYITVTGASMEPTLHTGDLVVLRSDDDYAVGDVVTYRIPQGEVGAGDAVIHRIVDRNRDGAFVTRGDNRSGVDPWTPVAADVLGREWFTVPGAGKVIGHVARPPVFAALGGGVAAVFVMLGDGRQGGRRRAGGGPHVRVVRRDRHHPDHARR